MKQVLINNQSIQIYPIDTNETFLDRVAYIFKTIPSMIYTDPPLSIDSNEPTQLFDLWKLSRKYNKDVISFIDSYALYFPINLIIDVWTNINRIDISFANQISAIYGVDINNNFDIQQEWKEFSRKQKKVDIMGEFLSTQTHSASISPYNILKSDMYLDFEYTAGIDKVFDILTTTQDYPFISFSNYYKIKTSFKVLYNWKNSSKDEIIIRGKDESTVSITSPYRNSFRVVFPQNKDINQIKSLFPFVVDEFASVERNSVSVEMFVSIPLNMLVLEDILLNTPLNDIASFNDNIQIVDSDKSRDMYIKKDDIQITCSLSRIGRTTRAYFTTRRISDIELVEFIIGKILFIYETEYNNILKYYKKINIQETSDVSMRNIVREKTKNRNLFSTSWIRTCAVDKSHFKIVPSTFLSKDLDAIDGYSALLFPKETFYFKDGSHEDPHYYYSTDPEKPFIGLKNAKTEIGFEVCAYKTDQKIRPSSAYIAYYTPEAHIIPQKITKYIIETRKKLDATQEGLLKAFPNVEKCFREPVFRLGSDVGENSVLYCILKAIGFPLSENIDERRVQIYNERQRLLSLNPVLAKQEMFDYTLLDITHYLESTEYLDPLKVIRLLEEQYEITLTFFTYDQMLVPYHAQGYYYKPKRYSRNVKVLINLGGEFDNKDFPHCELIVKGQGIKSVRSRVFAFEPEYIFESRLAEKIFSTIAKHTCPLHLTNRINGFPFGITGQFLDEYGKVRVIRVGSLLIHTSPMYPMDIVSLNSNEIWKPNDMDEAKHFMTNFENVSILTGKYIEGVHSNEIYMQIYTQSFTNIFDSWMKNEMMARNKKDVSIYLFSKYLFNNNILSVDDDVYKSFADRYILLSSNSFGLVYSFKDVSSISVSTETEKSRLVYHIKLSFERNRRKVRMFHTLSNVDNFYTSVFDFSNDANEFLVYTDESSVSSIFKDTKYVSSTLDQKTKQIYFIDNTFISGNQFLAVNSNNLSISLLQSLVWNGNNYLDVNMGVFPLPNAFFLYDYPNHQLYKVGEGDNLPYVVKFDNKTFIPVCPI